MADPVPVNEEPPKQGGQILGCVFAALAAGFIFFGIFLFMRACG